MSTSEKPVEEKRALLVAVNDPPGARPLRFLLWQIRRMACKKPTQMIRKPAQMIKKPAQMVKESAQMIRKPTGTMRVDGPLGIDSQALIYPQKLLLLTETRFSKPHLTVSTTYCKSDDCPGSPQSSDRTLAKSERLEALCTNRQWQWQLTYSMVKDRTSSQGRGLSTVARCSKVSQRQAHNFHTTVRLGMKYCEPIHDCPPNPNLQSKVLSDTPTSDTKNVASNNVKEEAQNLSVSSATSDTEDEGGPSVNYGVNVAQCVTPDTLVNRCWGTSQPSRQLSCVVTGV
ncbi:hypothetical protein BU15DRAFT_69058 [Melanogaster broomeanus]|nr:hypothetical protein BU15DRAFT_69058 [Melanogaster broomeanus]